ncbi:MAG: protein kinase [Verrucomicrobiae bacterium]|nr:protein kinase [Verrucomicrobiae bacterium]
MDAKPSRNAADIKPCPQCGTGVKFRTDGESGRKSCPHCGYVLPNQIAHFKLLDVIGSGGMGTVYRGMDTSLERTVAVKVMREDFAKNPQFVESFLREARAAAALNHPNVAQTYSFGEQNRRYYLVMELLSNGSLDDRIEQEHRVPELEALDLGIQVANGLRAAYERGLIHRDIKPGNILFGQDGSAKVVDFGLARFEAKAAAAAHDEGIWGTPYYIAPEKVSDNKEDFRSDIYSLGGTIFHAIAGRAPFEAGTSTEVVLKHLRSPAVSLRAFAPDCTSQTAEVIGRMLKRDPAERHQSYDELLNDLAYARRFAQEKRPPEQVVAEETEFSPTMLVGTLILIVVCAVLGIWFWTHRAQFFGPSAPPPAAATAATNADANATARVPEPKPTPPPRPEPPKPPPPPDFTTQVERALDAAGRGQLSQALVQLNDVAKALPADDALRPWVKLHEARLRLLEGRDAEAASALGSFDPAPAAEAASLKEAQYPALLAQALLGKLKPDEAEKAAAALPRWAGAILRFDAGLSASRHGNLADCALLWKVYAKSDVDAEHRWASVFQPMARDFTNEYEQFSRVEKEVAALQAAAKYAEGMSLLRDHQGRWQSRVIVERIKQIAESSRLALAAHQKEMEEKRRADLARQADSERALIEKFKTARLQMLNAYQFSQLLEAAKALALQIKLEENVRQAQQQIAIAQCLANFWDGLIRDVQAKPYDRERVVTRANLRMVGKLVAVRDGKLIFQKEFGPGQIGETACRWTELPPSMLIELGDYYLELAMKRPESNGSEIAQRAIALALIAREYALPQLWVNRYLGIANLTAANVKDQIELIFSAPQK